jgi:hypothetical protein
MNSHGTWSCWSFGRMLRRMVHTFNFIWATSISISPMCWYMVKKIVIHGNRPVIYLSRETHNFNIWWPGRRGRSRRSGRSWIIKYLKPVELSIWLQHCSLSKTPLKHLNWLISRDRRQLLLEDLRDESSKWQGNLVISQQICHGHHHVLAHT